MRNLSIRTLRANEIEVRPSHIKDGKANHLLYIDSRAVVSLLNETVGNLNWQSKFYSVNGQMIGEIGIYDEERGIWVWKGDTGSESNIEAGKGLISDVYKRALARWGVTELYTSPRIQVPDDGHGNSGYKVSEIQYNQQREICHLVIVNRFGKEVYRMNQEKQEAIVNNQSKVANHSDDNNRMAIIQSIKDFANSIYYKEGTNQSELKKFVEYYTNMIKEKGWRGSFYFEEQYKKWLSKVKPN